MDMEQFIEELQAYCKRSGHEILFAPDREHVVERTTGCKWVSNHDAKSLSALVRDGLGERLHKELFEAARCTGVDDHSHLREAVQASREYFARENKEQRCER